MIPNDGRKWGKDKITVRLTRRQWIMLCRKASLLTAFNHIFMDNYFSQAELNRAVARIEKQLPVRQKKKSSSVPFYGM